MNPITLKSCPFCGGQAAPLVSFVAHAIECMACEASTGPRNSLNDAAAAWNKRGQAVPMNAVNAVACPAAKATAQITPIFQTPLAAIEYAEGLIRCARMTMQGGDKEVLGPVFMCQLEETE